jgi:hypothetical protein
MVDDGFLIGFEDSSGNFVEVGRFNNTADDVTQPIEIKHQNSGERITLDSSGLKARKIDDDRLYAGAFPGSDPDARLSNAISTVKEGDVIYLENDTYSSSLTVSEDITLIGTGVGFFGTSIEGNIAWTFNGRITLSNVSLRDNGVDININNTASRVRDIDCFGGATITVDAAKCYILGIQNGQIELTANSSRCLIDDLIATNSLTDNGSANVIGDIA